MTTSLTTGAPPSHSENAAAHWKGALGDARIAQVHWVLRLGAAACFVGHGAFGIITKAAWVPYFGVVGVPSDLAYLLMPAVGTVDIAMGVAVLISPRPFVLLYMVMWALWTAMLRPLAGETPFETLERAGNYGVPLAMLLLVGRPATLRGWFRVGDGIPSRPATIVRVLKWTTALLLFGHGALAAITEKPMFATHYAALGLPAAVAPITGYAEMIVALVVLVIPHPSLLVAIA